jgi:glutamate racemase
MGAFPFDLVFCDTCIGGSTVASSLARGQGGLRAFYLADYGVNPLGVKSHVEVEAALDRWVKVATGKAPTLVVACNTASVKLQECPKVLAEATAAGLRVFSMVDLLDALIRESAGKLENRRVCVMGTDFTVRQPLYRERLEAAGAATVVPLPATLTERAVARLEYTSVESQAVIREEIGPTLKGTEAVLLACTCFPLVGAIIQDVEPDILLLDPGQAIGGVSLNSDGKGPNRLTLAFTGDAVTRNQLSDQARALFSEWEIQEIRRLRDPENDSWREE